MAKLKAIASTRKQLASKLPGAQLPANPGAGTSAMQKAVQAKRDEMAGRKERERQTLIKSGGPSSGSGREDREGRERFTKWVETRRKAVSEKTAKKTKKFFTSGPAQFWKNF